ncbi:unnamed protein product, partial [Brenthis ino]
MEMNGTETRGEEAMTLALSVAVTVISTIGLLLNAYILFVIVITKQQYRRCTAPTPSDWEMGREKKIV